MLKMQPGMNNVTESIRTKYGGITARGTKRNSTTKVDLPRLATDATAFDGAFLADGAAFHISNQEV